MKGLTSKQHEILEFIQLFIKRNHFSPSYREIMDHFSFASPGSVYKHVKTLTRKGFLTSEKHSHRSIHPLQIESSIKKGELQIPIVGNLSIGYPLELFVQPQMISVPSSMIQFPDNTYILQVQGDSLQEERIGDGDLILIESRHDIQPGEIILGLINQNATIVKRYFPEGQSIRLESQHAQIPPLTIRYEQISIHGVLIGLLRTY